ncbi:MAG: hypothetical protein COB46_04330 [Rhodospirillaceae bacterium]|nr:MAG: hypothetical protein COB46_04330 [Rhodospirillaceae bacterium]
MPVELTAPSKIDLWCYDLSEKLKGACFDDLSVSEKTRAEGIKFPLDRDRWVKARIFLRRVLSEITNVSPNKVVLTSEPGGKPVSSFGPPVQFNLSHSGDIAAVVTSSSNAVGVDVEASSQRPSMLAAIERWALSDAESQEVEGLLECQRPDALFTAWRRKEALLKGVGIGLRYPLVKLDVGSLCRPFSKAVVGPAGSKPSELWRIYDVPVCERYAIAVAAQGTSHVLSIHDQSVAFQ